MSGITVHYIPVAIPESDLTGWTPLPVPDDLAAPLVLVSQWIDANVADPWYADFYKQSRAGQIATVQCTFLFQTARDAVLTKTFWF